MRAESSGATTTKPTDFSWTLNAFWIEYAARPPANREPKDWLAIMQPFEDRNDAEQSAAMLRERRPHLRRQVLPADDGVGYEPAVDPNTLAFVPGPEAPAVDIEVVYRVVSSAQLRERTDQIDLYCQWRLQLIRAAGGTFPGAYTRGEQMPGSDAPNDCFT